MTVSQNGFPALSADSDELHRWEIPGTQRYFLLRGGSAGFLLCHFLMWFHSNIEKLNTKGEPWDEWAWAYRAIRGYAEVVSNHASGTAVDLNATKHPLGKAGTFAYKIRGVFAYARIRTRLLMYRGCIRWGGDYYSRKDEMHFEINRNIRACERVARRLMKTHRGAALLEANPGQRKVILS